MASSRPANGYIAPPPPRPPAATDGNLSDGSSRTPHSANRQPQSQSLQSASRSYPPTSYPPVIQTIAAIGPPAVSPSELKRRRPPLHQPSAFSLGESPQQQQNGDGPDNGLAPPPNNTYKPSKYHQSDGEQSDDYLHSAASPLLANTPLRSHRRSLDPDDKHSKHNFLRRLLMRILPSKSLHQPLSSKPRKAALGNHSADSVELWDPKRPVASALRIAFAVCAVVVLVTLFTLLVHGGPTALVYIVHPFTHLLSPLLSSTPQPSISPLSTSHSFAAASSPASNYTPSILTAVTPPLSSYEFTIVSWFYTNDNAEQSSPTSTRTLQWHSLLSFVALTPPSHIIIYTNQASTCNDFVLKAYPEVQCYYLNDYFNAEFNLPYVDRLLTHAHSHAPDDLIVYTHQAVLLAGELANTVHRLIDLLPYHQFVATSKRLDTKLPYELVSLKDSSRSYVEDIVMMGRAYNRIYPNEWKVDLLVYSKYWFDQLLMAAASGSGGFPAFVFADYYWLNHMLAQFLLSQHITTIDLTQQRLLFHLKSNDTIDGIYVNDMRALAQHNLKLARTNTSERYLYGQLNNIPYQLTGRCPACHLQLSGSGSIDLLARKQAEQNWLIIIEMSDRDTSRVWNWLCWAERANVSNYLLVTDATSTVDYRKMYELGFPVLFTDGSDGSSGLIGYLLQKGYSVLTMDLDHYLLQSPLPYLLASPFDVMVKGDESNLYAGIVALRSSHYSHYYYTAVAQCIAAANTHGGDVLVGCAASTFRELRLQVKGGLLDILHFPTVKGFFIDQLSQRTGTYPIVLEASERWVEEVGLNIHHSSGSGQCQSAQRQPFAPCTADTPIVVRILTSTNLAGLRTLLSSLSSAQYADGAIVRLEVAIDYPAGNITTAVLAMHQQLVSYASSFVFPHGSVLVSVQEEHVGSARLLVADHDESSDAHVLLVRDDVQLSSMWHITARHLLSLYAQRSDPQLMGISLTVEDVVLGETHAKRSVVRHALDEVDELLGKGSAVLYGWQRPSPAVLLFPGFYHELLYFVDRMQSAYPNYHPCVPTLITNHRRRYLEYLSKWMYIRGAYLLYVSLPDHTAIAVQAADSSIATEQRYRPKLLNVQTFSQLSVGTAERPNALRVFDFHLTERAPAVLESRAAVERRSKQCWVQGDWKDEAEVIKMDEDELMSEAEEHRRHALHRERRLSKQQAAALAAEQQHGSKASDAVGGAGLEGHKVAKDAVAGVRAVGGDGKGKGAKKGEWEEAAARDIAESQAHGAAMALKEEKAAGKKAEGTQSAPAAPAAPASPAVPAATAPNQSAPTEATLSEARKKLSPEQQAVFDKMTKGKNTTAKGGDAAPAKPAPAKPKAPVDSTKKKA